MKTQVFFIFLLVTISFQARSQVNSNSVDVFSPIYPFTYLSLDSASFDFFENGCLSIIDIRNEQCFSSLIRMYQTGEISLVAKKCSLKVYEIGEVLQYAFSGEIITYYRNGNKRSCYNLDSLGSINGKLLIYDTNGKVIYSMEYVNNMIYNGYYISKLSNQEIYLAYFEKGLKKKEYMFKEGKLLKYKKGSFRDFFYKKHLKQFNRLFHICDDYVQFSPGGRLM